MISAKTFFDNTIITNIGTIEMGIDGRDEYVLVKFSDEHLSAKDVEEVMNKYYSSTSSYPGGYFCDGVIILPHPYSDEVVAVIRHRYDV